MKKYRVLYWSCLWKTEEIIKANSREEAKKKFIERKGENASIIQITEVEE